MPNQYNFRSDVTTIREPRYLASRIVKNPSETILYEQIPASFGFETYDNIEVHFYSIPDNELVISLMIDVENAEEILKSHIVNYTDNTFKNYIRIDFTKLFEVTNTIIVPGDYRLVLNFFSDEIGDYNDRKLYIQEISETRTELQLAFRQPRDVEEQLENENEIREFVTPSFDRPTAVGVAEKIFASGIRLNDEDEGLTYGNVTANIQIDRIQQTVETTLNRISRLGTPISEKFKEDIQNFILLLYKTIQEEIVINSDRRIQENEFRDFISKAITNKVSDLQKNVDKRILIS